MLLLGWNPVALAVINAVFGHLKHSFMNPFGFCMLALIYWLPLYVSIKKPVPGDTVVSLFLILAILVHLLTSGVNTIKTTLFLGSAFAVGIIIGKRLDGLRMTYVGNLDYSLLFGLKSLITKMKNG